MDQLLRPGNDNGQCGADLVEFARGEFGIVCVVHALIPEDAPDFENLVLPSDDEALQIQLGRYPQSDWYVGELVGYSFKGTGNCASSVDVKHGCLDLHEAALDKVGTDIVIYECSQTKNVTWLVVGKGMYVRPSRKRLGIFNLLGQVVKARGKDLGHLEGEDGKLPG